MKIIAALFCAFLAINLSVADTLTVQQAPDQSWGIKSDSLGLNFDSIGNLTHIERLAGGKTVWSNDLPPNSFWGFDMGGTRYSAKDASSVTVQSTSDALGVGLTVQAFFKASGFRVTMLYSVRATEPDRLRTRFSIDHGLTAPTQILFYPASFQALPANDTSWFVLPYRWGQLMRTDKITGGQQPSPGQMWMQWTGYYDGGGQGLLIYPEDGLGFLKFAQYGTTQGHFYMGWQEVVILTPGQTYSLPYDYVIRPLATPNTFNDLAQAYGEYGRNQPWAAVNLKDKIAMRPGLDALVKHGIVKLCGIGGLDFVENGKNVFKDRKSKDQQAGVSQNFEKALSDIHKIETNYQVKPAYRYDGWWGRFDSGYPFVFPVNEKMGGDEKFAWFEKENDREGRDVILHLNPVQNDGENARFDLTHMLYRTPGTPTGPDIWSGNKLYMSSPYFGIPDNLETLFELRQLGARGVFWDVIGASSSYIDYNPNAHYPYYGRETFYQGLIRLFQSLRNSAPKMIFGTEFGQEEMLPYFDYAPVMAYEEKMPDGTTPVTETWAPLPQLVYGDKYANAVGIDANIFTYDDQNRAIRYLYGVALGTDARLDFVDKYSPVIRQTFETNEVVAACATELMTSHHIDPAGWRSSIWPSLVVIANTGSPKTIDQITVSTPLGEITVKGLRPSGFIVLNKQGHWAVWGAKEVSLNQALIVQVSNPDSILIRNGEGLSLASYGFPHLPQKLSSIPRESYDASTWTLRLDKDTEALADKLQVWPGAKPTTFEKKDDALLVPAPGFDGTLQTPRQMSQ